jgi:hypothetical protein
MEPGVQAAPHSALRTSLQRSRMVPSGVDPPSRRLVRSHGAPRRARRGSNTDRTSCQGGFEAPADADRLKADFDAGRRGRRVGLGVCVRDPGRVAALLLGPLKLTGRSSCRHRPFTASGPRTGALSLPKVGTSSRSADGPGIGTQRSRSGPTSMPSMPCAGATSAALGWTGSMETLWKRQVAVDGADGRWHSYAQPGFAGHEGRGVAG